MDLSVTSSLVSRQPSYFSYNSTDNKYEAQVNLKHICTYMYKYSKYYMYMTSSLCIYMYM